MSYVGSVTFVGGSNVVFTRPDALSILVACDDKISASRQAGVKSLSGYIKRDGVLLYSLVQEHWVKP